MPNSLSAKKRLRQNLKRRERNKARKSRMRTAIKKYRQALAEGDVERASALLRETVSIIDRNAGKGVIHRRTAARYKSRLSRHLNKIATAN